MQLYVHYALWHCTASLFVMSHVAFSAPRANDEIALAVRRTNGVADDTSGVSQDDEVKRS